MCRSAWVNMLLSEASGRRNRRGACVRASLPSVGVCMCVLPNNSMIKCAARQNRRAVSSHRPARPARNLPQLKWAEWAAGRGGV